MVERALQRAPGNSELETLRSTLRDRVAEEESERQKLQAMDAALAEGRRILQGRGAASAREWDNIPLREPPDSTRAERKPCKV